MKLLTIIDLTLRELRHGRLVILPLTVAVALGLVAANIQNPELWGDELLRGTWTGLGIVGALVAILAASGMVSSDVERGTMLLVASRPVSRATIVLGKFIGVTLYLLGCVALWAAVMAVGLGMQVDAGPWASFAGTMLVLVPMLLAAAVALTASALFPTRGAIGGSLALWFAASIVAAIPLGSVRPENVDRVELAQRITGWAVPAERLGELPAAALGVAVPAGAWLALLVGVGWLGAAVALFAARRSLAR